MAWRKRNLVIAVLGLLLLLGNPANAHPGNTAADGCHYCRTNCAQWGEVEGARHCHSSGSAAPTYTPPAPTPEPTPVPETAPDPEPNEPTSTENPVVVPITSDSYPTDQVMSQEGQVLGTFDDGTGAGWVWILSLGALGSAVWLARRKNKKAKT